MIASAPGLNGVTGGSNATGNGTASGAGGVAGGDKPAAPVAPRGGRAKEPQRFRFDGYDEDVVSEVKEAPSGVPTKGGV